MVREPRPGRISLGRTFQCFAGGDNLAAALHRQGECNNHERERACATMCKCNYYYVQLVCCEAFVKICAAIVKICAAIVRRWTRWPLSLQHGAGRQKSCTSGECQPRCQSARPAIRTSTNTDAKRHKMQPQIHNQQHNHNFSSLFFLSDTTSLEINCHKPNFWWISMMRERKKSLLVSKQRVDL